MQGIGYCARPSIAPVAGSEVRMGRLLVLGATRSVERDDGVELADPDGNEFGLRQIRS